MTRLFAAIRTACYAIGEWAETRCPDVVAAEEAYARALLAPLREQREAARERLDAAVEAYPCPPGVHCAYRAAVHIAAMGERDD